jgi:hypothetical protein
MKISVFAKMNRHENKAQQNKGKGKKRIIVEGSEDEDNNQPDSIIQIEEHTEGVEQGHVPQSLAGQSDETELQLEKQNATEISKRRKRNRGTELIMFNKNNLDLMLQDLNYSISRRGFKVSSDGYRLEALNTNIDEEVTVSQQVHPPCPFVTTGYFNTMVSTGSNTDPDGVVQFVMDCAKQFCETLMIQDRVILLEEEVRMLKARQSSV